MPDTPDKFTPEAAAAAAEANAKQIELLCQHLSRTLIENQRNDVKSLVGIPVYHGIAVEGHSNPRHDANITYDVVEWLAAITRRTQSGFDDLGRIQAAEKFSTGSGLRAVQAVSHELGDNLTWTAFENKLKEWMGQPLNVLKYRTALHEAVLHRGESLHDFYIRLADIASKWVAVSSNDKIESQKLITDALIKAMPPQFKYKLVPDDYDKSANVLKKATEYLETHPKAKLNDNHQSPTHLVAAINATHYSIQCYRCNGPHSFVECPRQLMQCSRCGSAGHIAKECDQRVVYAPHSRGRPGLRRAISHDAFRGRSYGPPRGYAQRGFRATSHTRGYRRPFSHTPRGRGHSASRDDVTPPAASQTAWRREEDASEGAARGRGTTHPRGSRPPRRNFPTGRGTY